MKKLLVSGLAVLALVGGAVSAQAAAKRIGIANFGEHVVLASVVDAFKAEMKALGVQVEYDYLQVNFDGSQIPQMLATLASKKPDLVLTLTTPVSQGSKQAFANEKFPVVFAAVTDPVAAALVPSWEMGDAKMTGASDLQDLGGVLQFIKELLPAAKKLGLPYNPGEANDVALRDWARDLAPKYGFELVEVGVDNPNDVSVRVQSLGGRADLIYIPASNLLQSSLAAVSAGATAIKMPVVNGTTDGVSDHMFLAAFSVDYPRVGLQAARLAAKILAGAKPGELAPIKPAYEDHAPIISGKQLASFGMTLQGKLAGCKCVVD